jgi:hypothetical protein
LTWRIRRTELVVVGDHIHRPADEVAEVFVVVAVDRVAVDYDRSVPHELDGRVNDAFDLCLTEEGDEVRRLTVCSSDRVPHIQFGYGGVDVEDAVLLNDGKVSTQERRKSQDTREERREERNAPARKGCKLHSSKREKS